MSVNIDLVIRIESEKGVQFFVVETTKTLRHQALDALHFLLFFAFSYQKHMSEFVAKISVLDQSRTVCWPLSKLYTATGFSINSIFLFIFFLLVTQPVFFLSDRSQKLNRAWGRKSESKTTQRNVRRFPGNVLKSAPQFNRSRIIGLTI